MSILSLHSRSPSPFPRSVSPFQHPGTPDLSRSPSPVLCRTPSPTTVHFEIDQSGAVQREDCLLDSVRQFVRERVLENPHVGYVNLTITRFCPLNWQTAVAIAEEFQATDAMIELHFTEALSLKDLKILSDALSKSPPFTGIDLSFNQINDEGMQILAPGLSAHTDLLQLDMSHNLLGEAGIETLLQTVHRSPSIQVLRIPGNQEQLAEAVPLRLGAFQLAPLPSPYNDRIDEICTRNHQNQIMRNKSLFDYLFAPIQAKEEQQRKKIVALAHRYAKQLRHTPGIVQLSCLFHDHVTALGIALERYPSLTQLTLTVRGDKSSRGRAKVCALLDEFPFLTSLGPDFDRKKPYKSLLARNAHNAIQKQKSFVEWLLADLSLRAQQA